jgi:hypothetical protein
LATSGIRFNDFFFSEPTELAGWAPPRCAGLFSILVNDSNWAPRPFQPLYFGELGNNAPPSAILHECGRLAEMAKGKTLLVSVLPLPFSTTQQRLALRSELVSAYNPSCQVDISKGSALQEHAPQMQQIMAGMSAATSEAPRRRIGFVT